MKLILAVANTDEQIDDFKRLEKSTYFHCAGCGMKAYTTIARIEAHAETCKK